MNVRGALRTGLSTAAVGMLLVGVAGPAQAQSASTVLSQSSARVLSGSIATTNLDTIAAAAGTAAKNYGGATVRQDVTPDLTLLNQKALTVPLGQVKGSLQNAIPGVSLAGLVEQKVVARANGSSSGTASTAGLGVNLGQLTQNATDALATLKLSVGLITAHAVEAALPSTAQSGSCTVAGLGLDLNSPLLKTIYTALATALAPLSQLTTTLNGLLGQAGSVVNIPTLATVLANLTSIETPDKSISIDLSKGTIHVDLATLLGTAGLDFCKNPNTKPLAELGTALSSEIPTLVGSTVSNVLTGLTSALSFCTTSSQQDCLRVKLGQTDVTSTLGGLLNTLAQQINTSVIAPLTTAIGGLKLGDLFGQLAAALKGVVDITTNLQSTTPDGTFRETALRLDLLAAAGSPVVRLNLATATVGPSAAAPTTTPPPSSSTTTPGQPIAVDAGRAGPAGDDNGGVSLLWVGMVLIAGGAGGTFWLRRKAPGHL